MRRLTRKDVVTKIRKGEKLFHYFTKREQVIFARKNPTAFGEYIAAFPHRLKVEGTEPVSL